MVLVLCPLPKRATPPPTSAKPKTPITPRPRAGWVPRPTPSLICLRDAPAAPTYLGPGTASGAAPARSWPGRRAAQRRRPWWRGAARGPRVLRSRLAGGLGAERGAGGGRSLRTCGAGPACLPGGRQANEQGPAAAPAPCSRRGARAPRTAAGRPGEGRGHQRMRAAGQGTGWETSRPRRRARRGGRGALGMASLDSSGSAVLGDTVKGSETPQCGLGAAVSPGKRPAPSHAARKACGNQEGRALEVRAGQRAPLRSGSREPLHGPHVRLEGSAPGLPGPPCSRAEDAEGRGAVGSDTGAICPSCPWAGPYLIPLGARHRAAPV